MNDQIGASARDPRYGRSRGQSIALVSTVSANVANLGAGVITGVATARAFEPSLRGILIAVTIWVGTISVFSVVGLDESIVFHARGRRHYAARLRAALTSVMALQAAFGSVALAVVLAYIVRDLDWKLIVVAMATLLIIPLNMYIQSAMAEIRSGEAFLAWNLLRMIPSGTYAAITVVLVLTRHFSLEAGLLALVFGTALTALACWWICGRRSRELIPGGVTPSEIREAQKYGRGVLFAMIPFIANQRMDQLLLGAFVAPAYLGIYAVAASVCGIVQIIGTTAEQVTFPRLAAGSMSPKGVPKFMFVVLLVATVIGTGIALPAEALIRLVYGQPYATAADPLRIMMIGVVFVAGSGVLTAEAKAAGRVRDLVRAQSAGFVVTATGLPVLVYLAGLNGAALASAIAYVSTFATLLACRRRAMTSPLA